MGLQGEYSFLGLCHFEWGFQLTLPRRGLP
jgi:hypothetical protein